MSALRFISDSTRSPTIASMLEPNPKRAIAQYGTSAKETLKMNLHKIAIPIVQEIPPIKPAILLFGLTLIIPRFFFPNNIPNNQANESQLKTRRKYVLMYAVENSKQLKREMKTGKREQ